MSATILIADPNPADAEHITRLVSQSLPGVAILDAASGGDALAVLAERRLAPSMIFAEFELPDMHGIEFLGMVRQERWLEGVPVAMVSNSATDREIVACYRLGLKAFLGKPAGLLEVRETLKDFAVSARTLQAASVISPAAGELRPRAA
ncbi:MAG TPA: response regulator [Tepidiformaceae bacterium]|nr:response regulator [Tepidiformaceae bacterium]